MSKIYQFLNIAPPTTPSSLLDPIGEGKKLERRASGRNGTAAESRAGKVTRRNTTKGEV
jgi:hypothetical protein